MDSIKKIFQIINYMEQHRYDEISLTDLCGITGYTKSYLCYMFKFYIGETPIQYYYKQKLKHGANLLAGNENVLDIAMKIGFNSHEAFTRAFKKEFGMTPVEYRTLYQKGLSKLDDLTDIEMIIVFSIPSSYRVFSDSNPDGVKGCLSILNKKRLLR